MTPARGLLLMVLLGAFACDAEDAGVRSGDGSASGEGDATGTQGEALQLTPRVVLLGLGNIDDAIRLSTLRFDAEIFLMPDDRANDGLVGDVASVEYVYDGGRSLTRQAGSGLRLESAGRYHVSVRLRAHDGGPSVTVLGEYTELVEQEVAEREAKREAARTRGDSAQSRSDEPTPEPMDGDDEPTPEPMDGDEEPTPEPMDGAGDEPTPEPMDGAEGEPTPEPMDEGDEEPTPEPMDEGEAGDGTEGEPTPEPMEPGGPTMAEEIAERLEPDAGEGISVESSREFTFYAGVVDVREDSHELVVTWDVRAWLRALLAQALGLEVAAHPFSGVQTLPGEVTRESGQTWQATAR